MISVQIDASKAQIRLTRMPEAVRRELRGETISLTKQLLDAVRANLSGGVLQKRSGDLYKSMKGDLVETSTTLFGEVYSDGSVPYARILEIGGKTKAHDIVAINAGALAFTMDGKLVFFKRVHHPGSLIPAFRYAGSALDAMRDLIVTRLTDAVRRAGAA